MHIRTRFAPSPTGFIHLGNLRSALYPWAFARHNQGDFILRIEDTDVERSSQEAVDVIIEGMAWLGMDIDEGPIYQMQRIDRYREVIKQMVASGLAYPCYMSEDELNKLRDQQMANKEKPRYNGLWRPEPGKTLPAIPEGVLPVMRFKNPLGGSVIWDDAVKGQIEISNDELDDLVIARPDGTPTYNFCVVVDDLDMKITHVIRGDDHVNNTPRQINIMKALGGIPPVYAHLPTVLNDSGEKMSKRNGAMSVRDYQKAGYLPDAILNYLARLGWSHGDDEIFNMKQFCEWFDLDHITPSAAQFNTEKLNWINAHYIKQADLNALAIDINKRLMAKAIKTDGGPDLNGVISLYRDRANTLNDLAMSIEYFYSQPIADAASVEKHLPNEILPIIKTMLAELSSTDWTAEAIHGVIEQTVLKNALKFPKVAMPLRVMVTGGAQSPSIDAVMQLLGKEETLKRMSVFCA